MLVKKWEVTVMLEANNQNTEKDLISVFPGNAGDKVAISRRFFVAAVGPDSEGNTTIYLSTGTEVYIKSTPQEVAKAFNI